MTLTPFAPRPVRAHGLKTIRGWRLKLYTIVYGGAAPDLSPYEPAWLLVEAALPEPAVAAGRPGVGFAICHHGRGMHYLVLAWWDRENELPLRVFVREFDPGAAWRPARGAESVCVWDLAVIGFERDCYVRTVLGSGGPDVEAYLAQRYEAGG